MVMRKFGFLSVSAMVSAAVAAVAATSVFAAGKVACVGNSITYGYGIESWPDQTSYPHHLQGMLRENAPADTVENFGVSGLTVRKDDQASYWKGARFAPAIEFAADTVIIELGTNDSKYSNLNDFRLTDDKIGVLPHSLTLRRSSFDLGNRSVIIFE